MIRSIEIVAVGLALFLAPIICHPRMVSLQNKELIIICEPALESAARDVVSIYPHEKDELEALFGWQLDVKPQVVLVKNRRNFRQMSGHALYVAFAVPEKNLVVIDYSKMSTRPFTLATTLKHELCHLLLHRYIQRSVLPRWLDEGVCQWASDGLADILMTGGGSLLRAAVLSDRLIPLSRLATEFPDDNRALVLAYEQSKSIVDYISREFGKDALVDILHLLGNGDTLNNAVQTRLSLSLDELQARWRHHLKAGPNWLICLANHSYGIVFFLAAVITIAGFVRLWIRKRAYSDEEDEE
jgi:hypothetical protein